VADFVESATLTAVTCTVPPAGTDAGALYTPPLVMVPTVELPPVVPLTFHVNAVLDVPCTVAVKVRVLFMRTVALVGEMLTLTCCDTGVTVTLAVPEAVPSATLVARIVTEPGGTLEGAVYSPLASMLPPPVAVHVTAWLEELVTVAVNCRVVDTGTFALEGETVTLTTGAGVMVIRAVPLAEVSCWLVA
jgi:hypothetical protein